MTNFCYDCSRPEEMNKKGILTKAEARAFVKCENFLWHVRCQLHYIMDLFFVGIDVIGDYLTEINVTCPTGVRQIKKLGGPDIPNLFWNQVEDFF